MKESLKRWIDLLRNAIEYADEQRTALAWANIGSVLVEMYATLEGAEEITRDGSALAQDIEHAIESAL